ncbi:HTTM domain-containing protein [Nocardioides cavernae]|uniref:HTTM domain-containing protein n=1 Tax=Nocardioides cavernae TaxID=1921566 RepID=A0ABR8NGN0_9ACTN|nr:HTTM domain-containing protein [Nocardioides cavernae]MBD3927010.1 HTTM domain-containing protein [Nocardioides cavernae]MBM7512730.1 putative membrane protein YphA (DoxX/SURF4 family) [Nocardioides cavernae]
MLRLDDVVDGRPLAIARIGIGMAGLLNCAESWVVLVKIEARDALTVPTWDGLPHLSPTGAAILMSTGVIGAIFVIGGLATRAGAVALATVLATAMLLEQQTYSNHVALSMWCSLWLVLAHSDARWSLRSRIDGPRDVRVADQFLLMTQVSVVYAFTGLLKANPAFLSGRVIQENSHLDISDQLAQAMALGAVVTEVGLCIGLWFARTRWIAAAAGVALHTSIPIVMYQPLPLVSFSISVVCLYPLFFARRVPVRPQEPDRTGLTSVTA